MWRANGTLLLVESTHYKGSVRPSIALIVLASVLGGSSVGAQTSVHATGELGVGYNDNIQGAPDDPPAGIRPAVSDFSIAVAPGITLFHAEPRWDLNLRYARAFVFFLANPSVDASADVFGADVGVALSPIDELDVGLAVARFSPNLSTLSAPAATTTEAQPVGTFQILRSGFTERYQHAYSETTFVQQSGAVTFTTPLSAAAAQAATLFLDTSAGPTWLTSDHLLAVALGTQYTRNFSRELADGTRLLKTDQVTPSALTRWQWTLAASWAIELRGGVALPFDFDPDILFVPLAGAGVYYENDGYFASLGYNRNVNSTLTTGQSFESDALALSGSVAVWEEAGLGVDGSLGIARNRLLDSRLASATVAANNWVADVGLRWATPQMPVSVGLRYQRLQQFDATNNQFRLPNYTRNAAMLTIGYIIPPRNRRPALRRPRIAPPKDDE